MSDVMTNLQKHLAFYNKEEEISFTDEDHRYFDPKQQDIKYVSATTFLGTFEQEFDGEFWGMYTALKNKGLSVKPDVPSNSIYVNGKKCTLKSLMKDDIYINWYNETRAMWAGITAEACHRGNVTHNYLEDTINLSQGKQGISSNHLINNIKGSGKRTLETVNDLDETDLKEKYPYIYDRLKQFIEKDCVIFAEKKLRLDFAQLAGMIDVPIIKRGTKRFCILDWKTNKDEFQKSAGYFKKIKVGNVWVKSDKFIKTDDTYKYPINHIPKCKLYGYALQLSLYAYMLECWGYELVDKGLEIIHIRPGHEPKLIKIPYLKMEIESLIKHRLDELGRPFFDKDDIEANFKTY